MLWGEDRAWTFYFFLPPPHLSSPGSHSKSPQFATSSLILVSESLVGVRAICCCLIKPPSLVAQNSNCLLRNLQVWSGLGEGSSYCLAWGLTTGYRWLWLGLKAHSGVQHLVQVRAGTPITEISQNASMWLVWPPDFLMAWWQGSKGSNRKMWLFPWVWLFETGSCSETQAGLTWDFCASASSAAMLRQTVALSWGLFSPESRAPIF